MWLSVKMHAAKLLVAAVFSFYVITVCVGVSVGVGIAIGRDSVRTVEEKKRSVEEKKH